MSHSSFNCLQFLTNAVFFEFDGLVGRTVREKGSIALLHVLVTLFLWIRNSFLGMRRPNFDNDSNIKKIISNFTSKADCNVLFGEAALWT